MMLGNQECDAETAYYLKHGTKPEYKYNCTASPPDCNWEKAYEPDLSLIHISEPTRH